MTGKVVGLRRATERPLRIAKTVAVGAAVVVVVGGVAMVVVAARHRAERRSLKRRLSRAVDAAAHPVQTTQEAARLSSALKSVASAAVPIVIKQLEQRMSPSSTNGKPGQART